MVLITYPMQNTSYYSQFQRLLATLLLFSILLQSCGYNNLEVYHNPPAPEQPGQVHGKEPTPKDAAQSIKKQGEAHLTVELPLQPAGPDAAPSATKSHTSHGLAQNLPQRAPAPRTTPEPATTSSKPHHGVLAATPSPPMAGAPTARKEASKPSSQLRSRVFTTSGGQQVQFHQAGGSWGASLTERPGGPVKKLPVACKRHGDVGKALAALQAKPVSHARSLIHVLPTQGHHPPMVYLGEQQLKGGMDRAGEASGSGDGGQEGAAGSDQQPAQAAPQGSSTAHRSLHERIAQGNITSTADLVEALNTAQGEEQQALQKAIRKGIEWFNKEAVGNLTQQQGAVTQEYRILAGIRADNPKKKQLLRDYWESLLRRARESEYQERPFIQALEYTLPTIDIAVFDGDPERLIQLANGLLARLNPRCTVFSKETYPSHRIMLYALHQALVLIQQVAPNQLNPTQEEGLYSRFKGEFKAISEMAGYYPIRYHALLLEQSLQRLESAKDLPEDIRKRVGHGLKGVIYFGQVARALSELNFNIEDFMKGCANLKAAFTSKSITAAAWYDWHQALHYASLLSLEDASKYGEFAQGLEGVKSSKIKQAPKEGREALRFGLIQQLRLLALNGPTEQVRAASTNQLTELAKPEVWGGKPNVMEGLLDALAQIAVQSQGAEQGQAQAALASLESLGNRLVRLRDNLTDLRGAQRKKAAQSAIQAWLQGCSTIEDRLDQLRATPRPASPASGSLFSVIHKDLVEALAPLEGVPDPLGKIWHEQECGWQGVWTRRAKTNIFDAIWTRGTARERAELEITMKDGVVTVTRKNVNSPYKGGCSYKGKMEDGVIRGTYQCDWSDGIHTWEARIEFE